jgi:hypothetical protein
LETLGKKLHQRLIGCPIHRRSGQADLEGIAMQPGYGTGGSPRLNMNRNPDPAGDRD